MPLFYWPYLGNVRQESIVMIIKGQLKRRDKLTSITKFEALKTVSKEFLRNSFLFSRYGPLKSSFLLIQKVSDKGRGNVRSIPQVTRKGAVTSETIFEFLRK